MSLLPVPTSQDLQVSRTESPTCLQQPWSPISNSTGFRPHLLPGRLSHHYQLQTPTPNLGLAHSGDLDALDSNPSPPEKTLPRQKSTLRRTSTDVPNTERPVILPVSDLRTLPKKTSPAQREFPVQSIQYSHSPAPSPARTRTLHAPSETLIIPSNSST